MSFPSTGSPAAACRTSVLALPSRCWRCSVRQPRGPCKRGRGRRQASSAPCRDAGSEKWGHLPAHPAHLRLAGLQGLACSHHAVPPPPRADSGPLTCSRCGALSFRDGWAAPSARCWPDPSAGPLGPGLRAVFPPSPTRASVEPCPPDPSKNLLLLLLSQRGAEI